MPKNIIFHSNTWMLECLSNPGSKIDTLALIKLLLDIYTNCYLTQLALPNLCTSRNAYILIYISFHFYFWFIHTKTCLLLQYLTYWPLSIHSQGIGFRTKEYKTFTPHSIKNVISMGQISEIRWIILIKILCWCWFFICLVLSVMTNYLLQNLKMLSTSLEWTTWQIFVLLFPTHVASKYWACKLHNPNAWNQFSKWPKTTVLFFLALNVFCS